MRRTLQYVLGLRNDEDDSDSSDSALDRRFDEMLGWALTRLKQHPEFKSFLREEASALLADLTKDATLQTLVKAQADAYLEHLREHPEQIQALVMQQSHGAASGILDVLRVRAARADDWLDNLLRRRSKQHATVTRDDVFPSNADAHEGSSNPLKSDEAIPLQHDTPATPLSDAVVTK